MSFTKKSKKKHPVSWVPTAYFAMGLPFIAIAQASVLMFKSFEISDTLIAFWTSLIMLPWTLKPLWSPLLEMFKTKKHFVVATQLLTGITFALVGFSLQLDNFFTYAIALLAIIAFSGATHDIATDGVYLSELSGKEQAKYIGWQGAFYNLAKLLTAGALVYMAGVLEERFGVMEAWMVVMFIYAIIMILLSVYHMRMLPSGGEQSSEVKNLKEGFATTKDVIKTFFQKKYIIWFIAFIVAYRFAEGFAIKIAPLFFKATVADGGLGLSTADIGIIYGIYGSLAFLLGSFLAGYYIAKRGLKKSLFSLVLIFNMQFVVYAVLAIYRPDSVYLIGGAVVAEYFAYGFGFVGLMLFMMQQVAPGKYKMAHYAFATGIMNLGIMLPGMLSGFLSDWLGYKLFFIVVLFATLPILFGAKFIPFPHSENNESDTNNESK